MDHIIENSEQSLGIKLANDVMDFSLLPTATSNSLFGIHALLDLIENGGYELHSVTSYGHSGSWRQYTFKKH